MVMKMKEQQNQQASDEEEFLETNLDDLCGDLESGDFSF